MAVKELSRAQMTELKQHFLRSLALAGKYASYFGVCWNRPTEKELANADDLVTDLEIIEKYRGCEFTPDDFHQEVAR